MGVTHRRWWGYSIDVTPSRLDDVPEVLEVHVVPSGDVKILLEPTITKVLFPWVTPLRDSDISESLSVHEFPSVEVRMVPE